MKSLNFLGLPDYAVSYEGKVYSFKTNKFLKPFKDTQGYNYIECYANKKKHRFAVHRLVAICFIPNPDNLPEVNHKWGDKDDNKASSLEWVTPSQNVIHSMRTGLNSNPKFTEETVHKICKLLEDGWRVCDISKSLGVERHNISGIKNGKAYRYISCDYNLSSLPKPYKISDETVIKICELLSEGKNYSEIVEITGAKRRTIQEIKLRNHYKRISSNYVW